jgi:hypothetical protein
MGAQGGFPHYFLNVWLRVLGRNGDFARFQIAGNRRIPSGAYVKNLWVISNTSLIHGLDLRKLN